MNAYSVANAYQQVNRFSAIEGATPHQLTSMLMQGTIDNLAKAKGMMERKDFSGKGAVLSKTIAIITELKSSLNMDLGGEIASNLNNLYDYMARTILAASMDNDTNKLDEVSGLMSGLLESWNNIPTDLRNK